jgi:hypothetical protein
VICAQLVHAAGESSPGNIPNDTHAVVLAVKDEQELLCLEARLLANGIPHIAIREVDEPYSGALMAIGLPPGPQKQQGRLLRQYPLLKE